MKTTSAKQYIVDAFAERVFEGNPAAVCVLDEWTDDDTLMRIAAENNLSETAFLVKEGDVWRLRWFTPCTEVEICGHATLAAGFVVMNFCEKGKQKAEFDTLSGRVSVEKIGDVYELDFPRYELKDVEVTDAMEEAFGARPVRAVLGIDLVCEFENEEIVRSMNPKQELLARLEGRIQNATARGRETDCVSRSFCPKLGIAEDPVCGSAHCQIADYWADVLGKNEICAWQASKRGGMLRCRIDGERMRIGGGAVLFSEGKIRIE